MLVLLEGGGKEGGLSLSHPLRPRPMFVFSDLNKRGGKGLRSNLDSVGESGGETMEGRGDRHRRGASPQACSPRCCKRCPNYPWVRGSHRGKCLRHGRGRSGETKRVEGAERMAQHSMPLALFTQWLKSLRS